MFIECFKRSFSVTMLRFVISQNVVALFFLIRGCFLTHNVFHADFRFDVILRVIGERKHTCPVMKWFLSMVHEAHTQRAQQPCSHSGKLLPLIKRPGSFLSCRHIAERSPAHTRRTTSGEHMPTEYMNVVKRIKITYDTLLKCPNNSKT